MTVETFINHIIIVNLSMVKLKMDTKEIKSKEIDEIINKLQDEGSRLRQIGQQMIDTAQSLNEVVYYYGHDNKEKKEVKHDG